MPTKFYKIDDVTGIDLDRLVGFLPGRKGWSFKQLIDFTRGRYVSAMLSSWDALNEAGINNALRLAHFFGQGLVETGWLNYKIESLNYSEAALIATFSKYRDHPALAREHARKPELIANTVYGGRMGNVNEGDGWRFRGRGFIQLTGRNNYETYADASGLDIVSDPDMMSKDLTKSIEVAAAFWRANDLNRWADENNAAAVSRGVNRGDPQSPRKANHEDERILWTQNCLWLTDAPERILQDANAGAQDAAQPVLRTGSRGERVETLQEALNALGYDAGIADGIFGRRTREALVVFQHDHGLSTTGEADEETFAALAEERDDPRRAAAERAYGEISQTYDVQPVPVASELAGAPAGPSVRGRQF